MKRIVMIAILSWAGGAQAQGYDTNYGFEVVATLGTQVIVQNRDKFFVCDLAQASGALQLTNCVEIVEPAN